MESQLPFITVAMPVRNEERFIAETLNALLTQDYPIDRYEIIVADGQSTDYTRNIVRQIAQSHPQVMLLPNPGLLSGSGRNVAFQNGKGDFFLVVDGHCKIDNNHLFSNVVDCFEKSGAQCLGRPQPYIVSGEPNIQRAIALARSSWLGHATDSFIHSAREGFLSPVSVGCAYRREVFEKIGFVDEAFDACEDLEFNYRVEKAALKTFFSPKIAIYYFPRENISELSTQLIRYGEGRAKFIFKHPETINLDIFIPLFFLGGVLLGPLFGFISKHFLLVYFVALLLYFSIVSIESLRLSRGYGFRFALNLIIVFFLIHMTLALGLIKGGCRIAITCLFKKARLRETKKAASR